MTSLVHQFFWRLMASGAFFLFFQAGPAIVDPDSYYHARMSAMQIEGFVRALPALPLTILGETFVDHHYLYHLIVGLLIKSISLVTIAPSLAPLIPLVALKVSTALFSAIFVAVFWTILERSGVARSWRWIAVMLSTGGWLFRVNLAKAQPLALILLFVGLWWAWGWMDSAREIGRSQRRARIFFVGALSFFYVWLYNGWVVWVALIGLGVLATAIIGLWRKEYRDCASMQWRLGIAVVIGVTLGLFINPYFPSNIWFSWFHIVKIGMLKDMPPDLAIGQEWYAPGVANMVAELAPLILAFGLMTIALLKSMRVHWSPLASVLTVASIFFFLLSLQSRRHYEYTVPMAIWLLALATRVIPAMLGSWYARVQKIVIATAVVAVMVTHTARVWSAFHNPHGDMRVAERPTEWLTQHVPEGRMVVLSSWDEFPPFWYYAPQLAYPGGLDARFSWYKDAERYKRWWGMANGKSKDIVEDMHVLGSTVAVASSRFPQWKEQLEKDQRFERRYADERFSIFVIRQ